MSRLRELRLHGFKTFADPTRFVFEPGVNAVIGPNGSGKSNMADAVRWVLGEQSNRSLRTRRADDVIFSGSQQRKAQGMAEAVMTLDNSDGWLPIDFEQVSIGRRAYRSGESEYLINGARARLRDVVELLGEGRLGANELVVVGQGTVDSALSLRPEERRQLFEEAAGVKNLQVRKNEALGRLARARDNLTRIGDLVSELRPQVKRLALQARHQQEHDSLGRRARALVGESHRRREAGARSGLGEARRAAAATEAALEALRAEQVAGRDAVEAAEQRYWEAEETARRAAEQREATHEEVIRAEGRLDAIRRRADDLEHDETAAARELAEARAAIADLESGAVDRGVAPAVRRAAEAEAAWRSAADLLADLDARLMAAEEALAEVRRQDGAQIAVEARRGEEVARLAARREGLERELGDARANLDGATTDAKPAEQAVEDARRAATHARDRRERARRQLGEAQPRADAARRHASELAERVGAMRGELDALEERAERGARLGSLLAAAGWSTLLDTLQAPPEAWPSIEAVVGGELELALVWRDGDLLERLTEAHGAARLLAASDDGRDDGAERDEALAAVSATQTMAEWIKAPAGGLRLFRRTVVAPDLPALLAGWRALPSGWLAVTPGGDVADGRGIISVRGKAEAQGGEAARRHARRRELGEALKGLEAEQDEAAANAARAMAAVGEAARMLDEAQHAAEQAEAAERQAGSALAEVEQRRIRAAASVTSLVAELEEVGDPGSPAEPRLVAQPVSRRAELEDEAKRVRADREAARVRPDEAREAWLAADAAARQHQERQIGQQRERAMLDARLAQLEADGPRRAAAQQEVAAELAAASQSATSAREADAAASTARSEAETTRQEARTRLLELERGAGGDLARLSGLERAAQAAAVEMSRHEEALAALARERELALDSLPAIEGASSVDGEEPADELTAELGSLDDTAVDAEQRRVRRTLAQIGSVNPFAVEEHRELSGRLDELSSQETDLTAAITSTEELIARLDTQIAEQFNAAFAAIGERFDEFCRVLFAGGSASLHLGDGSDGDAPGGIEIVVQPPGKRLQRLAMLSGGERALTGVALLFAMLSVNPVPFCILDEVDAALDEANIGRFADALRKLAEGTDFVVITHNRATIEVADTIYGVTMTDAAVSKIISLRLADLAMEAASA